MKKQFNITEELCIIIFVFKSLHTFPKTKILLILGTRALNIKG